MNNAKIWLVVKPTVGIPLFLSAVAVGSFAVHVAVLSNTTWVADFLAGRELGSTATAQAEEIVKPTTYMAENGAMTLNGVAQDGVIKVVLPDGRTARLVVDDGGDGAARTAQLPAGARE